MDAVFTIQSEQSGPTVAIFGGVHGNEQVGIQVVERLRQTLQLSRGTIHLVLANPPAITAGARQISKNLNRCFLPENKEESYEDGRARELMGLLDNCDALLDIHAFNDSEGEPFVICEPNSLEISRRFSVPIISTNWTAVEPGGSDGYMYLHGKIGVCIECGPASQAEKFLPLALDCAHKFLTHFNMIETPITLLTPPAQRVITVTRAHVRSGKNFKLRNGLRNFQLLEPHEIYGYEDGQTFTASDTECIIFPRPDAPPGTEAFIIGVETTTDS